MALAAVLYCLLPTRQYYWDGVLFSLNIEDASTNGTGSLFLPNHPLYNPLGYLIYRQVHAFLPSVRALAVLQSINIAASLATAWLIAGTIRDITRDNYLSATLTAAFAFGATWWKYSVDADAYILPALLLLSAARLLIQEPIGARRFTAIALLHVGAMSIHQLSIFFLPAVWIALFSQRFVPFARRVLSAVAYTVLTALSTLAVYHQGYLLNNGRERYGSFFAWLTSHSEDSSFLFRPVTIASATLTSYVQLLFGGRLRLLIEFFQPWTILLLAALVIAFTALAVKLWRYRDDARGFIAVPELPRHIARPLIIFATWLISFAVFLLIWLPKNTFYKLLLWPAIVVIAACILKLAHVVGAPHRNRLALFAVMQICWNLAFFIYPYSQTRANAVLDFGEHIARQWPPHTKVFFHVFNSDNWTVRYASPQTVWVGLASSAEQSIHQLEQARTGETVWLDPSAVAFLSQEGSPARNWLDAERQEGRAVDCCGTRWRLQFTRLLPR